MRLAGTRHAALLFGSCVAACAVYTEDALMPLAGDVSGAGTTSGTAGSNASGTTGGRGGSPNSGSSPGGGASKPAGGAPTTLGGSAGSEPDGGEPAAQGGAPGEGGAPSQGGEASGGAPSEPAPGGSGGSAGTGGKPPTGPSCDDHPLTARSSWIVSSLPDYATGPAANLLDNETTRWTTGKAQTGDEWLQVDFGQVVTLSQINLQQAEMNANDYPRGFTVTVSNTDLNLTGTPHFSGMGKSGVSTTILLPALSTGRYLLIEQTGSSLSWWSAVELEVSCVDPD